MTSVPSRIFAQRLRQERESAGFSQAEFAELVSERLSSKIDPSAITRIEGLARTVKLDEAVAMADVLRLPLGALLVEGDADAHLSQQIQHYRREQSALQAVYDKSGTDLHRVNSALSVLTEEQNKLREHHQWRDRKAAERHDRDSTA
ncbi:MAG: helix-turn-helix domain-containing protein [Pseudonocardiaceae bacterium]